MSALSQSKALIMTLWSQRDSEAGRLALVKKMLCGALMVAFVVV